MPLNCFRPALAAFVLSAVTAAFADGVPDWENQAIFRINKEEPHATKMPFPDANSALKGERMESPWCLPLNGLWKLHWVGHPDQRPLEFFKTDYDDSGWGRIPVPSNVELHGFGRPVYTNVTYPFKVDPPRVMGEPPAHYTSYAERNPVSSYRHRFALPDSWKERRVFIVFNGVNSAFNLWLNGEKIGYSEDSRTPAEFDITKQLRPGENLLAVEVYRYSDGSYLEDQDFWRLSGIFRDVYLWSADALDVSDFEIQASLDDNLTEGSLSVSTKLVNRAAGAGSFELHASLLDEKGAVVAKAETMGKLVAGETQGKQLQFPKITVKPWSAEEPTLYSLLLTLKDREGHEVAHYARKVGFRSVRIRDGNLLVNGKPILIKGVNRHDHNPLTGQTVSVEDMRADLEAMKRLNINAVRTSHYPNDPRLLELCDEYGFYVISEANIESHGMGYGPSSLAKDPSWGAAHLDRVRNMVETFKNHPCVILWSLGNEAGDGINFEQCSAWLKQRDPSRPVHYEQAGMKSHADLFSPMYFEIRRLEAWCREEEKKPLAQQKPMIQCEYNHTMGNSSGGLAEYWELIRRERLLQGGFIWDWKDQGLLRTKMTATGEQGFFAYGGDFGDYPNDNNFCCNGVMRADLRPNPHAAEVFHQYRNLHVSPVSLEKDSLRVSVKNEGFFKTLERQPVRWSLLENGKPVHKGDAWLNTLPPQGSTEFTVPVPASFAAQPDREYHLTLEFMQGMGTRWAQSDFVIAREQLALPWGKRVVPPPASGGKVRISEDSRAQLTYVAGDGFLMTWNDKTGQLISYWSDGRELLKRPLQLNLWRAPTDNDRGNGMPRVCAVWREAGAKAAAKAREVLREGEALTLRYDLTLPAGETTAKLEYQVHGAGSVTVSLLLEPKGKELPVLPRIALSCAVPSTLDNWTWFGRGPGENYRDRWQGSPIGVHSGKVGELWHPYVEPQETANRTEVRSAEFTDAKGRGLRILSADDQLLELGAYPFTQDDLESSRHPEDLPRRNLITIHISHAQMGVAGENSWGAWPLPPHQLKPDQKYQYRFRLEPVTPASPRLP